jgi:AraC family transcriptional regulator, regulatory protein of adaptative response / methylated-DNA-[protein]-cysteine methyltransferase
MNRPKRRADAVASLVLTRHWAAVLQRDASFDGKFVYGVRTTGIYCRPSCPSRRPDPRNVRIFADAAEAEAEGFRSCLRCSPGVAAAVPREIVLVTKACRYIERAKRQVSLKELAANAAKSQFHFHRLFKSLTGITPKEYASACRLNRMRKQLSEGRFTVADAIYASGYNSASRFYEISNRMLGMTPGAFRARGMARDIQFVLGECRLGSILIAIGERGICSILIGDDPDVLVRALEHDFAKANLARAEGEVEGRVGELVSAVGTPASSLDLPPDIQAAVFQYRVWKVLASHFAEIAPTRTELRDNDVPAAFREMNREHERAAVRTPGYSARRSGSLGRERRQLR